MLQFFYLNLFQLGSFTFDLVTFCWIWLVAKVDAGSDGLSEGWLLHSLRFVPDWGTWEQAHVCPSLPWHLCADQQLPPPPSPSPKLRLTSSVASFLTKHPAFSLLLLHVQLEIPSALSRESYRAIAKHELLGCCLGPGFFHTYHSMELFSGYIKISILIELLLILKQM